MKVKFSEEEMIEHEKIGKEYARMKQIEDRKMKKDVAIKIRLQDEAINAIPTEYLRSKALEIPEEFSSVVEDLSSKDENIDWKTEFIIETTFIEDLDN